MPEKKQKIGIARKIAYLGEDTNYWDTLQNRYLSTYKSSEFKDYNFKFIHLDSKTTDKTKFYDLYLKILKLKPAILYIDFSKMDDRLLESARLLKRDNSIEGTTVIVGLIDKLELVNKFRYFTGIGCIHIKCGEHHDVVYDAFLMAYPDEVLRPDFALAKFDRKVELIDDFRVVFACVTYMRVEGNISLTKGEKIELNHNLPNKNVPSKFFVVRKIYEKGLIFDFRYAYDLEYIFVDEPVFEVPDEFDEMEADIEDADDVDQAAEQMEQQEVRAQAKKDYKKMIAEKMAQYKEDLQFCKKKHKQWVINNAPMTPAKMKILFVDRSMGLLSKENKSLERLECDIRCQTALSEDLDEIKIFLPDMIAIQFPDPPMTVSGGMEMVQDRDMDYVKEMQAEITAYLEQVSKIIDFIKREKGYQPFLVLFNTPQYTSKSFQDNFKYEQILSNKYLINLSFVVDMAKIYQKKKDKSDRQIILKKLALLKQKDPKKYRRLTEADINEPRYYFSETASEARASYGYPVDLTSMTESECTFLSDLSLELQTYRFNYPLALSLTLIPELDDRFKTAPAAAKKHSQSYRGLLHSIGEPQKQEVRRFVNEIFFSDLNEQREKERQEFEAKKKEAEAQKVEEEDVLNGGGTIFKEEKK